MVRPVTLVPAPVTPQDVPPATLFSSEMPSHGHHVTYRHPSYVVTGVITAICYNICRYNSRYNVAGLSYYFVNFDIFLTLYTVITASLNAIKPL